MSLCWHLVAGLKQLPFLPGPSHTLILFDGVLGLAFKMFNFYSPSSWIDHKFTWSKFPRSKQGGKSSFLEALWVPFQGNNSMLFILCTLLGKFYACIKNKDKSPTPPKHNIPKIYAAFPSHKKIICSWNQQIHSTIFIGPNLNKWYVCFEQTKVKKNVWPNGKMWILTRYFIILRN